MIPTYNEAQNIEPLLRQILRLIPEARLIVVDDASPDGTGECVKKIAADFSQVELISRTGARGRGLAGVQGFEYAVQKGYDPILEMDADGSHAPEKIPDFLEAARSHDVVIGSRYLKKGAIKNRGMLRNALSGMANGAIRVFLKMPYKDCTSGFRCFRKKALESIDLSSMVSTGPSIVFEVLEVCHRKGFDIVEIPIDFLNRERGDSKLTIGKLADAFGMIFKIRAKGKNR